MIVVDASVFAHALLNEGGLGDRCRAILDDDDRWIAPQHWTAEVMSVIRRLLAAGKITRERAGRAVEALERLDPEVPLTRVLVSRMWELRDNLTAYDAAHVAAVEAYDCVLVTADARLANAPGIRGQIQVVDSV
ncbi:type II toxin-antitoxin system VapC family toxin [Nocardia sp. NPDC004151]|uniref:type II toxin-antitoxin system VapC family toxin n=1 Tax=Nocardia sp. NPDC004151 TaxID=3364304 RepID=UPI003680990C